MVHRFSINHSCLDNIVIIFFSILSISNSIIYLPPPAHIYIYINKFGTFWRLLIISTINFGDLPKYAVYLVEFLYAQDILVCFYSISAIVGYFKSILNLSTLLFQTIKFNISMQFSFIWLIDTTLSSASTLGQSGPGSDANKGVLLISQSSSTHGTSPSDCFVSYPGHSLCFLLVNSLYV